MWSRSELVEEIKEFCRDKDGLQYVLFPPNAIKYIIFLWLHITDKHTWKLHKLQKTVSGIFYLRHWKLPLLLFVILLKEVWMYYLHICRKLSEGEIEVYTQSIKGREG